MNGYSEDLREKIVAAARRRTWDLQEDPKKSSGSTLKLDEKATKLLEADLKQRPFTTLQERRDYIHALTGSR